MGLSMSYREAEITRTGGYVVEATAFTQYPFYHGGWVVELATATQWVGNYSYLLILAAVVTLAAPLFAWGYLDRWQSRFVTALRWFALVALLIAAASMADLVGAIVWNPGALGGGRFYAGTIATVLPSLAVSLVVSYIAWSVAQDFTIVEDRAGAG